MSDLPSGWEWAPFADVAAVDSNLVSPADYGDLPHIAPNHIESRTGNLLPYRTVRSDGVTSPKHLFAPGHILYSKIRPYLAKAVRVDFAGLCSADMYPVSTHLDPQYLLHWMLSTEFTALAAGQQGRSVLPKINREALAKLSIPVPPLAEQERIVAAIEEHITRLDTAVQLAKSVEAHLGALDRSVVQRLWDEPCARKPLGEIGEVIAGPAFRSAEFVSDGLGVRLLRGDNIEPGALRWKGARFWPTDRLAGLDHLYVERGDLILAMDRPVISSGLKLALAQEGDLPALLVQRVARIRLGPDNDAGLVYRLLQHPNFERHLLEGQTGTQVPHVTLEAIRSFQVPAPEIERQRELAQWSDDLLTVSSRTRHAVATGQRRAGAARRSILAAAFSGHLVPQDPDDKPASVLLERIRAERAAAAPTKRTRKATS